MSDGAIASLLWAGTVAVVLVLIALGIFSSKLRARRNRKRFHAYLPEVLDHVQPGRSYRVVLSNGTVLPEVQFQGSTSLSDHRPGYDAFPFERWLVLRKPDGKRVFVKPPAIRFYEEI